MKSVAFVDYGEPSVLQINKTARSPNPAKPKWLCGLPPGQRIRPT